MGLSLDRRGSATVADVIGDMLGAAGDIAGDLAWNSTSDTEDSPSLDRFPPLSQSGGDAPEYLHSRLQCTTLSLLLGFN